MKWVSFLGQMNMNMIHPEGFCLLCFPTMHNHRSVGLCTTRNVWHRITILHAPAPNEKWATVTVDFTQHCTQRFLKQLYLGVPYLPIVRLSTIRLQVGMGSQACVGSVMKRFPNLTRQMLVWMGVSCCHEKIFICFLVCSQYLTDFMRRY